MICKMHLWLIPLLLGSFISSTRCLIEDQKSFNHETWIKDSRYISHQDLMSSAKRFMEYDTSSYNQLLFDVARNQVIVGARDTIYRMSFDLELLERSVWEASPAQIAMCQAKGQSEHLCRNYVRVLQSYGENQLYACGTYAFNPNCSWRQMENLTIIGYESGVGKCPFNPYSNITSLMSSHGKLFVGTATDFSGSDAAVLRTEVQLHVPGINKIIRTKQYNNKWLSNPQFVGSFEADNFVYFLFRETAVEYMNCGKIVYSRIARVCKNDAGGDQILKDNWTSFVKARLNCSLPGDYPFYYNEIQDMTYSVDENVLYATFSTPENSIAGSAICAYNLSAINQAFEGPFKYQDHIDSAWKPAKSLYRNQFECEIADSNIRYKHYLDSSRYQLMDRAVQPLSAQPLYHAHMERFTKISLDTVHTKTEKINVIFVATNDNIIKKLSVKMPQQLQANAQSCVVEVWQADTHAEERILSMEYLKLTDSLYVGMQHSLNRIPAQHCGRHISKNSCINAMDPYCGWNELIERCTAQELGLTSQLSKYWLQSSELKCPDLTVAIDGAWSAWSEWTVCKKHVAAENAQSVDDGECMCRARDCNNPRQQNGGKPCEGITTQVQNCTVHGGWTDWSAWSSCSQTCGIAVKTRRRSCGNPKPAFGGRMCVGSDRQEMYCSQLPPCPAPKPAAVDGGWGPWGEWSDCSARCNGGFRIRRRECNDPAPKNGGLECIGCNTDFELCNSNECDEVERLSAWTPWLQPYNKSQQSADIHREHRYRFSCKASMPDAHGLHIQMSREQVRLCKSDGSCHRSGYESSDGEEHATEWGPCSVSCGGGMQYALHESGKHRGRHTQARACNTQQCPAAQASFNEVVSAHEWSCWSDWSACSVSCGLGVKRRTRKCLGGHEKLCNGRAIDEEKCAMKPCEDFIGWSDWSEWSECSHDGIRFRHRKCLVDEPAANECKGHEYEKTACVPGECEGAYMASTATFGSIIAVIILLYAITIFMTYWLTRRHYRAPIVPLKNNTPTPSYDVYPNQYSSLPTKDIYDVRPKVKRQSSFNSCSPLKDYKMGTLNRNNISHNHTPKVLAKTFNDSEMGTLKRNSHLNNQRGSSIDDEKF